MTTTVKRFWRRTLAWPILLLVDFLLACECDFRGRPGYEERPFPEPDHLRQALRAASSIHAAEIARSAAPASIREAIFQARAEAVAAWRDGLRPAGLG